MKPRSCPGGQFRRPGLLFLLLFLGALTGSCGGCFQRDSAPNERISPLTAEEQLQTFILPDGFEIELVAADPDMLKVVDISFDDAGRMWAVTASEYPMDQNDEISAIANNDVAGGLAAVFQMAEQQRHSTEVADRYRRGGRDQVLVFDTPAESERQTPRIFAEGMFLPLSVLPLGDGVLVCQGPDILRLQDNDGDGKADSRTALLTGFGVQDSHSSTHRLTRGPGGWIYFAQGALTLSDVRTPEGSILRMDAAKVARFQPDGTQLQIFSHGLLNIWGLVIDGHGDMWIQEANDSGYPVLPVFRDMSYPGLGRHRTRPYTPWYPPPADFRMGGTGLSGLALVEGSDTFPDPFRGSMLLANPITRTVNSVRIHRDGEEIRLEKGPDLVESSDPWFRPVAIHIGPDNALYIVDWYNKIISHNEVSRTHPERDKVRSRIWRVRHRDMPRREIPDLTQVAENELLDHLKSETTWEARAAWHQIADRKALSLAPGLFDLLARPQTPSHLRLLALWSLEDLGAVRVEDLRSLFPDPDRAIRRQAVRILGTLDTGTQLPAHLEPLAEDPDYQVRLEIISALDRISLPGPEAIDLLLRMVKPPLENSGWIRAWGEATLGGASFWRAFERSRIRAVLEEHPRMVQSFLGSEAGQSLLLENRLLAFLALGGRESAVQVLPALRRLERDPSLEEVILVVSHVDDPSVRQGFQALLQDRQKSRPILDILALFSARVPASTLENPAWKSLVGKTVRGLIARAPTPENEDLMIRLVSTYRLQMLEPEMLALLGRESLSENRRLSALQALLEIQSQEVELFQELARDRQAGRVLRQTALSALAGSGNERAMPLLVEIWDGLAESEQKVALTRLTSGSAGSRALLKAISSDEIPPEVIDTFYLDRLKAVLGPDNPDVQKLQGRLSQFMKKVLYLPGGRRVNFSDTNIDLEGPFTVESWMKLEDPVQAGDGLLGEDVSATFNFHEGRFRVTLGSGGEDLIVARTPAPVNQWFHIAVTRDQEGLFKIYLNGALDSSDSKVWEEPFRGLDIGRTQPLIYAPFEGTAGSFSEFRVWNVARSDEEIWGNYRRTFEDSSRPASLVHYFHGDSWGPLNRGAQIVSTQDYPVLLTEQEALALQSRFAEVRELARRPGDVAHGRNIFEERCMVCHRVGEEGKDIGPVLDGAAANGLESLLRSVLTPNAGVEPGYRAMRVLTHDGDIQDGFLVSEDARGITLRQQVRGDLLIPQDQVKRAYFLDVSIMPEGLIDDLNPGETSDLFAYLMTLK